MARRLAPWFLAALLLVTAGLAAANPPAGHLLVTGLGLVPAGKNPAEARERAVDDALTRAVGQALVQLLEPAALKEHFPAVARDILPKARQFVASFSLLQNGETGDRVAVLVAANLDQAALDKALLAAGIKGAPPAAGALPPVLVMVSEEAAPGRPPVFWWSGAAGAPAAPAVVRAVLEALGTRVLDPAPLVGKLPPDSRQPVAGESDAVAMGRQIGAGLVLVGRLRTHPLVTSEGSPSPLLQIEVLETAQGKVLAEEETEGPVFRETPGPDAPRQVQAAIEAALRKLMLQAQAGAPAGAVALSPAGGEVTLTIGGLRSLAELKKFEQALQGLPALVEAFRRESVGGGSASLRLKLKGTPAQLADQLLLGDYGTYLLNVVETQPGSLKLTAIPKAGP